MAKAPRQYFSANELAAAWEANCSPFARENTLASAIVRVAIESGAIMPCPEAEAWVIATGVRVSPDGKFAFDFCWSDEDGRWVCNPLGGTEFVNPVGAANYLAEHWDQIQNGVLPNKSE